MRQLLPILFTVALAACDGGSSSRGFASSGATAATTSSGSTAPAATPATTAPPSLPKLTVQGRRFVDPQGRVVFLRGANYSHRTKSQPHWQWQEESHLAELRGWGMNCVRYLLLWKCIEPQPGVIDQAYLDHVVQVLDWAERNGIYVLLDMHQDLYSEVFGGDGAPAWAAVDNLVTPNELITPWFLTYFTREVLASFDRLYADAALQDHYAKAWRAVVERTRGRSCVIGLNLMNEPCPGNQLPWDCETGSLPRFYERVMNEVLAVDPDATFFLEPLASTSDFGLPSNFAVPPTAATLVWAPHYYDPYIAMGQPWPGEWTGQNGYGVHERQADGWGQPLFVGEFGAPRTHPDVLRAIDAECRTLERLQVSGWTMWDHNPDPRVNGVLEPEVMNLADPWTGEHPALDAFVRPFPARVAGEPRSFSFDLATRTFTMLVDRADPSVPTVIRLPARHYPTVTVRGTGRWIYEAAAGELSWWGDPAVATNSITISQ